MAELDDKIEKLIKEILEKSPEKKPKSKKITIYVYPQESWKKSLINDITTIALLTGLIWVNEATLASNFLNFLLGLMGLAILIGWILNESKINTIKGKDTEEIITKLRKRLAEIEADV